LLGLTSVWLMVLPLPADAPVMLPVTVPIVHVKVLEVLADNARLGLVLLQIASVAELVTTGLGLTVTVIVNGEPAHPPVVEVGVTIYCTVPAVELLGLVRVWLMVPPLPAVAPVIPPVMVPIVHAKFAGALDVSVIPVPVPVQIAAVAELVTAGVGFTVTVMV
jgi:hypothetical protein